MKTKDLVYISLFAAFTAALSLVPPIMIPALEVPITTQSIAPMLAGGILGRKKGALSLLLFLLLVAAGLPLLPGGRGGFAVFAGPTGGFLIGWMISAFIIGFLIERKKENLTYLYALICCLVGGILCLYIIGIPWTAFVLSLPLSKVCIGAVVFIFGDLIKAAIAAMAIVQISRIYPLILRPQQSS